LEAKLKVPEHERCRYEGELKKAEVVSFRAVRVWDIPTALDLDATGRPKRKGKENSNSPSILGVIPYLPLATEKVQSTSSAKKENKLKVRLL
jgi:hypothetical protein